MTALRSKSVLRQCSHARCSLRTHAAAGQEGEAAFNAHHAKLRTPDLQPASTNVRLMHTGPCLRSDPPDSLRLWAATVQPACSELPTQAELKAASVQHPALQAEGSAPNDGRDDVGGRRPLQHQHSTLNTAAAATGRP